MSYWGGAVIVTLLVVTICEQARPPDVPRRTLAPGTRVLAGDGQGDLRSIVCWQQSPG